MNSMYESIIACLFSYFIGVFYTALATGFCVFESRRNVAMIMFGAISIVIAHVTIYYILGGN